MAVLSMWISALPFSVEWGLSALTLAIAFGMFLANTIYPVIEELCAPGIDFVKSNLLRLGIILFGFRVTFQDISEVGLIGIVVAGVMLSCTFMLSVWIGKYWFHMDKTDAILIGAGASICGAAAVLATQPVARGRSDQVVVAVATVVIFGTIAMFGYPLLYRILHALFDISDSAYGIYVGSTVHEVAQVVVAGASVSKVAAGHAVITKMIRVMMLAPFLLILSAFLAPPDAVDGGAKRIVIPWFAIWFLIIAAFNSMNLLSEKFHQTLVAFDTLILAMAMGALGLTTHVSIIRKAGVKPLALAALLFAWLVIGGGLINAILGGWI